MSKPSFKRAAAAKPPNKALGFLSRVRARRGRLHFMTPIDWLLSMLLVLQLVGTSAFANQTFQDQIFQDPTVQGSGLSSLSAAIGKPVPICRHRKPGSPTPSMPSDCDHCTVCHVMAGGVALLTVSAVSAPAAIVTTIAHRRVSIPLVASLRAGSASPRGPPSLA
jgi:hypothetical protein